MLHLKIQFISEKLQRHTFLTAILIIAVLYDLTQCGLVVTGHYEILRGIAPLILNLGSIWEWLTSRSGHFIPDAR